jgi:Spy/CpxP family protein refolding chaperone
MAGFMRTVGPIAATVAIILAISIAAHAQREEGRRGGTEGRGSGGGFGISVIRLASIDEVQEALNLSEEQKDKIAEINDQMREDFLKLLHEGGAREAMQKLNEDATAQLAEILDEQQKERLTGISIQVLGARAVLMDPALAEKVDLTDEQKSQLKEVQQSNMRAMRDAFREIRGASEDERWAKAQELRENADKELMAVLTPEQQEQLKSLEGEKVEIELSQLFGLPRRGDLGERRSRGDRDGDRDRGRGERAGNASNNDDAPSNN